MIKKISSHDLTFMRRCFTLARRGEGFVSPNPLVGCIIVKNKKIIAEGFHHRLGSDHAEVDALRKIDFKAKGATLYCNLEPCSHHGRTPPCINSIIASGVKRVVIAHRDPNPLMVGKSIRLLKKAGIQVVEGVCEDEARFLNRVFLTWITKKRPHVILKAAISLDGKITPSGKKTGWITGEKARTRVHELRARADGVLVGVNTVINDDPLLTVRKIKEARQPYRIIVDSRLRTPAKSRLFKEEGGEVFIATVSTSSQKKGMLEKQGAWILSLKPDSKERVPLKPLLKILGAEEISSLLVEGGSEIFTAFLRQGLADEIILHVAPRQLGPKAKSLYPPNFKWVPGQWHLLASQKFGPDREYHYIRR